MARRTYTLTELLGLRANQAPVEILAWAKNPEIADIVRRTARESSGSGSSCRLPTARHKDDSSVTSDELIFKGTVSRRMGRELAREASHNSIRPHPREHTRDIARDDSQASSQDPSRPMEWKYRGRSETEAATAQPIPAPTGVPAQRDEGFQRFYKAVVSPTHVRVTAGGRIVPNTRGPPSPTAKRTSDNSVIDSPAVPDKTAVANPPAAPVAPIALGQVPVLPQLLPGYPPGFQSIQAPVSFVPMALGTHLPPGFSFAQPAVNPAVIAPLAPGLPNTQTGDDQKVKPSVPEPFFYNGQLMYPVGAFPAPLGNPMVPIHMVGVPHGVASPLPGQYMQPQPTRAISTSSAAPGSSYAPSTHSLSGIPPVNHIVPADANFNAASAPPISSIKPSDITKKQIAAFKQNLKYHEDQLQFNRHQIDEKDMEQKIQTIKGHIQRFEATLRSQLEYEEAHLKATQGKEEQKPPQPAAVAEEQKAPSQPPPPAAPREYGALIAQKETDEAVNQRIALATHGLNTNMGESGKATFRSPVEPTVPQMNAYPNAAGLPSDAALAPVFQPRGYASTWTGSNYAREMKAYEEAEKRLLAVESKSMEHMRAGERCVSQPFAASGAPVTQPDANAHPADSSSRARSTGAKQQNSYGVPYLLGTLPKGVNPRTARDQDYIYKRPLTDEERRARFLYWGKAPKSAVKGLPKFDGKHFYPPSPVKEHSEPAQESETRTTDSESDPFRSTTPVQRAESRGLSASEDNCTAGRLTRSISFETQVNSGSEDFTGGAPLRGEDSADAGSVGSNDRRGENSGAKLWQSMLKKGPTSSALSSTTAQGFLPHYTGNAAASLTPSLTTNQLSSARGVPGKVSDMHEANENSLLAAPEKRENCPPGGVSAMEDQFKHLTMEAARRNLTSGFSI